jgi:opacity protein-like surface antigen
LGAVRHTWTAQEMKSFSLLQCGACLLLLGTYAGTSARAAELPLKAPPPPPPPSWTGFFFGANFNPGEATTKFFDIYGPNPDYALDADSKMTGMAGGFQLGYNYQIGQFVVGAKGTFDWASIKHDFSCFSFGNQTCSSTDEWIGSLTGRFGPVIGPALLYVDGGPAWTRDAISNIAGTQACVPAGGITVCSAPGDLFQGARIMPGWTIGGGIEYRISANWSAFVEYDYFNFGEHPITLADGGTGIFPEDVRQQLQLIQFGFDYALEGPPVSLAPLAYGPGPSPADDDDDTGKAIRVFSLVDVAKDSVDGLVGGLFAFSKDLNTSGPRMWITGGAGAYQYPASGQWIRGVYSSGDLLGGYAFEGDNYEINLLAGASVENDMLSAYDPSNPVNGTEVGPKVRGDVWVNPTEKSLFYGEAEYTTAFQTYYTSAKYGYDVFNKDFFLGPEVTAFGDERFDQWRVGAHITQLKFGQLEVDVSAGFAHDSVVGDGAYGHVEMSREF